MCKNRAFTRGIGKLAGYFASLRPCQSHDYRIVFGLLSYWNPAIRVIYLLVSSNPGNLSYWNPANPGYLSSGIQQLLNCMMADTRKRVSVFCSLLGRFPFPFTVRASGWFMAIAILGVL
jgi:hypothetical protein